jgi:hypothetical protein
MNIEEFKKYLCELIDEGYKTAKAEGTHEIMFPFTIQLKSDDQIEFSIRHPREKTGQTPDSRRHGSRTAVPA